MMDFSVSKDSTANDVSFYFYSLQGDGFFRFGFFVLIDDPFIFIYTTQSHLFPLVTNIRV